MIKCQEHSPPREQFKQAIYNKFVQLREFDESDFQH